MMNMEDIVSMLSNEMAKSIDISILKEIMIISIIDQLPSVKRSLNLSLILGDKSKIDPSIFERIEFIISNRKTSDFEIDIKCIETFSTYFKTGQIDGTLIDVLESLEKNIKK